MCLPNLARRASCTGLQNQGLTPKTPVISASQLPLYLASIASSEKCAPVVHLNGIGRNGIGRNGIGRSKMKDNGIGRNGIGRNGIGRDGIGRNGIGRSKLSDNGIGRNGIGRGCVDGVVLCAKIALAPEGKLVINDDLLVDRDEFQVVRA